MPFGEGSKPGERRGGRRPGSPNKSSLCVRERIIALGGDPVAYLVATMNNKIPCATCRGLGRTKFQPKGGVIEPGLRVCQSCWGSKLEKIAPAASQQAAERLMNYIAPTLRSVEVSGVDGGPIDHAMTVCFVEAENGRPK